MYFGGRVYRFRKILDERTNKRTTETLCPLLLGIDLNYPHSLVPPLLVGFASVRRCGDPIYE
jgi:hypothetical protein